MFTRKRRRETSSPDPDAPSPQVTRRSSGGSLLCTGPVPSRKRRNSSSGGSQSVKRRRVEWDEEEEHVGLEQTFVEVYPLGEGGFGSVIAGFRQEDLLPVAVKYIPINTVERTAENLPLEVVLMQMVGRDQSVPEGTVNFSVELLDWFELQHEVALVMERPLPCSDLFDYIKQRGCLQELEAKVLLRQLVEGMIQVHARGVLHRDLKPENLLVQTGAEGPLLRLVDFGSGCLLGEDSYTEFDGTTQYIPPEFFTQGSYQAEPTTVWQIGVVLYDMLCGKRPFTNSTQIVRKTPAHLSCQCKDLLRRCLSKCPRRRPSLHDLLQDPWLSSHTNIN